MRPGNRSFGTGLAVAWDVAQSLAQRRSFQAAGGVQGVSVAQHPQRGRLLRPTTRWGMSDAQERGFIRDQPDYVILCHGVPIGWHATRDDAWRFPVRKQETPMMVKYRLLMHAMADLAAAAVDLDRST